MDDDRLGTTLRAAVAPDEDAARERALLRLHGEFEALPARRSRVRGRLAVALSAAALTLVAALSPPGDAVADWVRTAVGLRPHPPAAVRAAGDRLPAAGRLLHACEAPRPAGDEGRTDSHERWKLTGADVGHALLGAARVDPAAEPVGRPVRRLHHEVSSLHDRRDLLAALEPAVDRLE